MTLRRITPRTWALALLGNASLLLLGSAWLYIPDSRTWEFLFSVLLAIALLACFLALYSTLIRRVTLAAGHPLWRSTVILAGWLLLGHILQHLIGFLSTNVTARAGYWNSQLSAHHRATFTYERLVAWQHLVIEALLWIVVPSILLPFTVETVARPEWGQALRTSQPWRTAFATLKRWELWLSVALAYIAGSWLGNHLLDWRPAHSTTGEVISLAIRTVLVYGLAVALLLLTLAVVAELLSRQHPSRDPAP